jgi:Na+-translocating ferredoxin:NAD+ oxidoreductase RnfG subunit
LAILVHAIRISIVAALLVLIPSPRGRSTVATGGTVSPGIDQVRKRLPAAEKVLADSDPNGFWTVVDASGDTIARVARTLPQASDVIGYRGPSEAMILVDPDFRLIGVDLIQSSDTDEHVLAVKNDTAFFDQFRSWNWNGPDSGTKIDGVSGATLTSLALAKGVLKRIGGDRPSLVFPDAVAKAELTKWFSEVADTRREDDLVVALDRDGKRLGAVIRTGPLSDSIIGYQGPTELLIQVDSDGSLSATDRDSPSLTIADVKIRSSYDNEPYVGYCKTEYGFWSLFKGKTIPSLASMDIQAAGVEGVSGATMTSVAIAETLVAATAEFQSRAKVRSDSDSNSRQNFDIRLTAADLGCVVILLCIPLFRIRGWFRKKQLRFLWLIAVACVIGLWSGNLISMALVAGWSAEGVAWRLAPALAAIMVVAFASPIVGKANPYCNHLCPHGAIQQLVRPTRKSKRYWKPPSQLINAFRFLPGTLLVIAYLALIWIPATDLSSWEPFHAYLFRIAPWTALAFAGVTLLFSAFVPMGYCRLGCPTGRLIDHLRRTANSNRFNGADAVSVVLLLVAISMTVDIF